MMILDYGLLFWATLCNIPKADNLIVIVYFTNNYAKAAGHTVTRHTVHI